MFIKRFAKERKGQEDAIRLHKEIDTLLVDFKDHLWAVLREGSGLSKSIEKGATLLKEDEEDTRGLVNELQQISVKFKEGTEMFGRIINSLR